jgi:hypothetical protein
MSAVTEIPRGGRELTVAGMAAVAVHAATGALSIPGCAREIAMAHVLPKVARAYLRDDLLDQRREMMQAWAQYRDLAHQAYLLHLDSFRCVLLKARRCKAPRRYLVKLKPAGVLRTDSHCECRCRGACVAPRQ